MDDSTKDVKTLMEREADKAPPPRGLDQRTVRRARLMRARLLISSLLGVTVLAGGAAVGVRAVANGDGAVPDPASTEASDGDIRHEDGELGLAITIPDEWSIEWTKIDGERGLFFGTSDFDLSHDFCEGGGALEDLPAAGAFIWLYEFDAGAPPRSTYELKHGSQRAYPGAECHETFRFNFTDNGRSFSSWIALGKDSSQRLEDDVEDALNTIEVEPPEGYQAPTYDFAGMEQALEGRGFEVRALTPQETGEVSATEEEVRQSSAEEPGGEIVAIHLAAFTSDAESLESLKLDERPVYVVETTGHETGNCFYLYDTKTAERLLGICFFADR